VIAVPVDQLPCWSCSHPQVADIRYMIGQGILDGAGNRMPSGLPLTCCRIRPMGTVLAPSARSSGLFPGGGR
jgi:hypothetical protein